jgi:hypothetical protein
LEQKLYEQFPKAILNKIKAIAENNPKIEDYMAAAERFIEELQ